MAQIEIEAVDERDSSWEIGTARFRVYLHSSGPETTPGSTWTYDITGADAIQAIDWAQRQARAGAVEGRVPVLTWALALVRDDAEMERVNPGHGRGLIWLVGMDGNDNTEGYPEEQAVQRRMLLRKTHAILIPAVDTLPPGADHFIDGEERRPEY
jgi:hypothetical protein